MSELNTNRATVFLGAIVSFLYMLFYCYDYLLQTSFSILPHSFLIKYSITTESFGFLSAAFFYGYTIFQIPLGYCLDRIGLKKTAIMCAACCAIGTALFYYSGNFAMLFAARFLIGAGTACACVMSVYAVSTWLLPKYFSIGVGAVQVAACLGSIFGQAMGSTLTARFGWDATMHVVIYFAAILFVIYLFLPKHPSYNKPSAADMVRIKDLPRLLINKQIITIAILGFISWAPVSVLAASWMVRLLNHNMGWSQHQAAHLLTSFWIGLAIASLLIGKISDKMQSRRRIVLFAFVMQCLCGFFLAYTKILTPISIVVILFLLGAAASVQTLSFILTAESVHKKVYGAAAALVNMTAAASGGVINPIFGIVVAHTGSYFAGLWLFPVLSMAGILMTRFMLRETYSSEMNSVVTTSIETAS
ncbi:MAG: hypothetical protein COY58_01530 [Gammaproteobacteria bacterium CG_4_10_14_0_8_um_filter_38_16]|nr:MAG: hypothetical protein COY58_01530 [Gammaproteobacteria bacterium CG_4_10_14_0_8_um_filter_38_16]PJA03537.1 MAG: hypothetical protein COX72_04775 [Gammaproteobacteria bacterium CG_4_10_14_0_2_um_filter_38_22]PJB11159.1 MAG: hypothetical protein CO120_01170 [Gammaproteobacteria bacterium CG_4_9_14_3_um_filter_38_9]